MILNFVNDVLRLSLTVIISRDVRATENAKKKKKKKLQVTYMYLTFIDRPCCRIGEAEIQQVPLQTRK